MNKRIKKKKAKQVLGRVHNYNDLKIDLKPNNDPFDNCKICASMPEINLENETDFYRQQTKIIFDNYIKQLS